MIDFKKRMLSMLAENYEAAKNLTEEDCKRPSQELLIETYEDLQHIVYNMPEDTIPTIVKFDQPSDVDGLISELKNYGISAFAGLMPPIRFVEFNSFEDIFDQCWEWQDAVFDTTAEQACNGIRKEAKELQHAIEWQTPAQIHIEVADVLMYAIYVAKKYGMNWDDVKHALKTKLEINKSRNWRKLEDGTHRHI